VRIELGKSAENLAAVAVARAEESGGSGTIVRRLYRATPTTDIGGGVHGEPIIGADGVRCGKDGEWTRA